MDIIAGRETLVERDNSITVPKSLVGTGLDFISRITGVYVPYSYIPGNYFRLEPPRGLGTAEKIIISKDDTIIMGGAGERAEVADRVSQIEASIDQTSSDYDREKL